MPFSANIICLVAMSGFMSLMFPTIYGIALGGLDQKALKLGAAGLIMAILGGAIITPWMAGIIGDAGSWWSGLVPGFSSEWDGNLKLTQASLRASFFVPAICFAVVGVYALVFRRRSR
jgi:FHS family L-fucose permease-like MFS transporter